MISEALVPPNPKLLFRTARTERSSWIKVIGTSLLASLLVAVVILAFTWPTTWQTVSSGWSATWTQSARAVRVTSDAALAPGATTTVGFVASYSGPNVLPAAFTLNGTVCASI